MMIIVTSIAIDTSDTNNYCMIRDIAEWNTYVVEWTAQSIKIIYNGQVCGSTGQAYSFITVLGYFECAHSAGN